MVLNILVVVMCVIVILSVIWSWWLENGNTLKDNNNENIIFKEEQLNEKD